MIGGIHYTPHEVSELLVRITVAGKKEVDKVYDPTCGPGSSLLYYAKVLGKENVRNGFFGQEINSANFNLCRINMFLHNLNYKQFSISHGNTLSEPAPQHLKEQPFEAIVSHPPYSLNWEGDTNPKLVKDTRFAPAGILAPSYKADLAFVMHSLAWLAPNGTAAIVVVPGVLYRIGRELKIRKYLIDNNFVDAVIQLPPKLFYNDSNPNYILVLKKKKSDRKILFIDAKSEFEDHPIKYKLTPENIQKILNYYKDRRSDGQFSRLVDLKEIKKNEYNINLKTYLEQDVSEDEISFPELNASIENSVARQNELRMQIKSMVTEIEVNTL